jgi:L-serine dehydratase
MKTSLFDLFKIGIGPSSSHTVGPMRAARLFVDELEALRILSDIASVTVSLYGSLALTGVGHGTDRAIILGLEGERPDEVDPSMIDRRVQQIRETKWLSLAGKKAIFFDEARHLRFFTMQVLPKHSNGMRFVGHGENGATLHANTYYSIGGGFVITEGAEANAGSRDLPPVPIPFRSARELLESANHGGNPIWRVMLTNEMAWHSEEEIRGYIQRVWQVMKDCMERGLSTAGELPGGLYVRRRARNLYLKLAARPRSDALNILDWVNLYAIAVSEENAAGGRVVTAPTNGAAGIIPAVARHYTHLAPANRQTEGLFRYFLTAAAIGVLYKENASISGAEVGCQGEVGVACSMAAGGLVAALGGTNEEVEQAAEIGMEHNLGMTCDPIGGLVQIPCIERNAMGAVKAVNAARLAMSEQGRHHVSLDQVIATMYQTGLDMHARYKETSLAGLAAHGVEC